MWVHQLCPHKVNPINFENAEGNLKFANSILSFFGDKLPISRLQRDLSDCTVVRNFGVAYSHMYLGIVNIIKGLDKLVPNKEVIRDDLNKDWSILGEAVQTMIRKNNVYNGYEIVKGLMRNYNITGKEEYIEMVEQIDIEDGNKKILLNLTLEKYSKID
jgi:adenylosuccinate lyase